MATPRDVIDQHIKAFNDQDRDAEPWTEDATMEGPGASVSGRDDVLDFLGVFWEAFPDGRLTTQRVITDGTAAAAEGTFTGTHDGVFHTPDGDVAPTGKPVEFRWAATYETAGDQLASEHLYFDQVELLGALGLMPS
jgi:predicted ester cyclase